jgi:hypothetical protein
MSGNPQAELFSPTSTHWLLVKWPLRNFVVAAAAAVVGMVMLVDWKVFPPIFRLFDRMSRSQ